jgi:hypothetical protein
MTVYNRTIAVKLMVGIEKWHLATERLVVGSEYFCDLFHPEFAFAQSINPSLFSEYKRR